MFALNNIQKRFLLFLIGCVGVRLLFVYLAKTVDLKYLRWLGLLSLLPAIGWIVIYLGGNLRKSGGEVFGGNIWWNFMRPIHALLYIIFAYFAYIGARNRAWKVLFVDVIFGLIAFLNYHYNQNNFTKLF